MKRLLILDDDATMLALLSRTLGQAGLDIITCRELEAAEAVLDSLPVDVMMTDLCVSPLGGLDGVRLVKHLSTHFPAIRVVVVSGNQSDSVRDLCRQNGAAAFIPKPVEIDVLSREMKRLLGCEEAGPKASRTDLEELDGFLASGSIRAVLQPIVPLGASAPPAPHAYEGLARGPKGSLLGNPEILFAYAGRKDRLYETDLLCIRAALAEASCLPAGTRFFLNVQPRSLTRPGFAATLSEIVLSAGHRLDRIVLELTEQQTILNPGAFGATLAQLRDRGFRIALDDYGVGYSNLQLLEQLLPDYLKISGHFCRDLALSRSKQIIVGSTAGLAATLGIPTILEHVETAAERDLARELGVTYGQGYLFGRPAPGRECAEALQPALAR